MMDRFRTDEEKNQLRSFSGFIFLDTLDFTTVEQCPLGAPPFKSMDVGLVVDDFDFGVTKKASFLFLLLFFFF